VGRVNSVGVLPLHHVSGLVAWTRCAVTGGRYVDWEWKKLEAGIFPSLPRGWNSISLVPTQLQRLLINAAAIGWLRQLDAVFVGGGAPWDSLLDSAAAAHLPVSVGYGMTETAAMACGQRPEEFLAGDRSSGSPLPHIRLSITADGVAVLAGESIFRGYYPAQAGTVRERSFVTDDFARIDESNRVYLMGRRDAVIITGGKKVDPTEVEAVVRAAHLFSDLAVVGLPDSEWGQVVALCYPATDPQPTDEALAAACASVANFKRPRRVIAINAWPRTAQGKVSRATLAELVSSGSGVPPLQRA
jgi:O-succinylbenzoic acid--CoA ligase